MGLGGALFWPELSGLGSPVRGGMQHPRAPQELPRRGLWLVPGALGPCWRTCPPACPRGGFLGVAAQPQTCFTARALNRHPGSLGFPRVPHPGASPSSQGQHPVWGRGEQTGVCAPLRSGLPLGVGCRGCHFASFPSNPPHPHGIGWAAGGCVWFGME